MLIVAPSGIVNEEIFLLTPSSSSLLMFIGTVAFDDEVEKAIEAEKEFIKSETLALDLVKEDNEAEVESLNGHDIKINIEKM